ncbi:MAG: S1/P1 nuclease, partial [Bryobacteraceae bacterium]
ERLAALRAEPLSAYNMAWLVHLVGDIHQPLHCVARFTGRHLNENTGRDIGDQGGNLFLIDDSAKNLHALWDNALGATDSRLDFVKTAASLATTADLVARLDTASWVEESVDLAKSLVYTIGDDAGKSSPPRVTPEYRAALQKAAQERIAAAGYRLAALLNARLQ